MGSGLNLGGIVSFNERKQLEHDGHATICKDKLAVVVEVRVHLKSSGSAGQSRLEGQLACPCVKTRDQVPRFTSPDQCQAQKNQLDQQHQYRS
jgi:hypothetical protein